MSATSETSPKVFLGTELRRARIAAGFASQDSLAGAARFRPHGDQPGPRLAAVRQQAMCWPHGATRAGARSELFARLGLLARNGDGPIPTWFEDWLEAERAAVMLRIWQPLIVPGLLQTADYARALFLAGQTDTSDDAIDALVNARLARQAVFEAAEPPETVVVLDESVLRLLIGSAQVMHDQLSRVVELAARPYLSVQVVPLSMVRTLDSVERSTSPARTVCLTPCVWKAWKTSRQSVDRWYGRQR